MRNKLIRSFGVAGVMLACSLTAGAQILSIHEQSGKMIKGDQSLSSSVDLNKYELLNQTGNNKIYVAKTNKTTSKSSDDDVTVTCKINYVSKDYYSNGDITVVNKDFKQIFYAHGESGKQNMICKMPAGTYDFITTAVPMANSCCLSCVVKEQVKITKDTTIEFNVADATKLYKAKTVKPNGEDFSLSEMTALTDQYFLVLKGIGLIAQQVDQDDALSGLLVGVYLNDVSDRYKLCLARAIDDGTNNYICKCETNSMKDTLLSNRAEDFVDYKETFSTTPAYNPQDGAGAIAYRVTSTLGNLEAWPVLFNTNRISKDGSVNLYVCTPKSELDNNSPFNVLVSPHFGDQKAMSILVYYEYKGDDLVQVRDTSYYDAYVCGLPALVTKDGIEYVNASHDECGDNDFHYTDNGNVFVDYPGHPAFSFTDKQKVLNYGMSCPINSVMEKNIYDSNVSNKVSSIICSYIGRNGEVRGTDLALMKTKITYNKDTVICDDYFNNNAALFTFASKHKPYGVIEAEFVDSNVVVDGLAGRNYTYVYYDQNNTDFTAPTLQMLMFKDNDGMVTDRFKTSNDGIITFAGGDFNYQPQDDYSYFDCKSLAAKVFYSPYNEDNWTELTVEEDPEKYYMPCFGHFYQGSLSEVKGQAKRGWFDLKIVLTDESGNDQEQIISPAFRIDSLVDTGIENVGNENAVEVSRYSVDGKLISSKQRGINIVKYSNGKTLKVIEK